MIWLVGGNGMLGTELASAFTARGLDWVSTDREVNIADAEALRRFTDGKAFDWIVNCAAYTAVDRAESEPALAAVLNKDGPRNLAEAANRLRARLIHMSTDYVFSGDGARPYQEEDSIAPQSVYGRTKAEGEVCVRQVAERAIILRTAWLFGKHGPNFVYTMLRLMRQKSEIGIVGDQVGSPTWTGDLASAIVRVLEADEPRYGTYHYTNGGVTSWYEFAVEIHRIAMENGILLNRCEIRKLLTAEYPTKAKRPAYSVLSKDKIVADYGVTVPHWRESTELFLSDVAASYGEDRKERSGLDWDSWLNAKCRLQSN